MRAFWILTLLQSVSLAASDGANCTIFWSNSPVGPNQTAMLAGAHFPSSPVVQLTTAGSGAWQQLPPVQVTSASIMFVIPPHLHLAQYAVRVCDTALMACSNQLLLNRAQLWWVAGDRGNQSTAGGWIRLFGVGLDFAQYERSPGSHSRVAVLEERMQAALRSRDVQLIGQLAKELSSVLSPDRTALPAHARSTSQMQLQHSTGAVVVLPAANGSMWEATFKLPEDIPVGTYKISARNQLQQDWTDLDSFGGQSNPHIRSIQVLAAAGSDGQQFQVADYMSELQIPEGGLNYTTGAPVNATEAMNRALAAAEQAGGGVVLLPVGKLFIDGPIKVPAHTIIRGAAQELSTIYFLEDGIGRQLGGLTAAEGGSSTPDPGYIYCNCTEEWGLEHLSIYVTHFSNSVVFVPPGASGFTMRSVLIRQVPYFCEGFTGIVPGGGNGHGKGAPPPIGHRDEATQSALEGHSKRIANWTSGSLAIGAVIMLEGASNVEISDCDITCTQWCVKAGTITWLPLAGDPAIVTREGPPPHHLHVVRNVFRNADVGIAMDTVSQSIVEHNHFMGSVLGGGAIYPSSVHQIYFGHNKNENHWSGDRESMTFDGNGGGQYYGPVASSAAGTTQVVLPSGTASGGGDVMVVLNGTGMGQVHPIASFDPATRTFTLASPLAVTLAADSFIQTLSYQARNIFAGNVFADNGAFQIYGSGIDMVVSGNVARRFGGFMAWGQWYGVGQNVTSVGMDMRQLWLDNEVLDENGVRNYMSSARHTPQGARLQGRPTADAAAEQSVDLMGSFQFNGFSFGVEGSSMANRPDDAPPLNSFMVWRGNKVKSNGGFSLGADVSITPGSQQSTRHDTRQPHMAEILMENNQVEQSAVPFAKGDGIVGLFLRHNSFDS